VSVRLDGKVVLISGASSGVGRGAARVLAERGAKVVAISRRREPAEQVGAEISAAGGEFRYVQGDVGNPADCDAAVAAALRSFGRLDVLLNNAANPMPLARVDQLSDADWRGVLAPTLDGVMQLSRAALRPMREQGDGVILTVVSIAGVHAMAGNAAYGAAKAAAIQLTRVIAVENFGTGVRANCVIVGAAGESEMAGPLMLEMGRTLRGPDWQPEPNPGGALAAATSDPASLGRAISLLCCDDAREINGAVISMDSGMSAGLLTSTALYLGAAQLLPG
jgi:NAD(P)-dependent dehydrogenase (short-subunit alcohol dehydrogenase family)